MTAAIRTVLGDIPPAELGICDAHDHLFLRSPRFPGRQLDDPPAAEAEANRFRRLGGQAVVQWTPFGLGRRATEIVAVSRSSGVHIVAATGLHQAEHYTPDVLARLRGRLAGLFIRELTRGMRAGDDPDLFDPASPDQPRAGLIKVAAAFHRVDDHARRVMIAAARAHHATGAPIGVHLELGTAALDVLDLLCVELAVPPDSVILAHLNRFPDERVHREAAEAGAYLAFDGPSRAGHATDWRLFDLLTALVRAGHGDRLLLGGDTTTASARAATGGGPGMPFLLRVLRPRLERELGADMVSKIFVTNPARAFAAEWH